MRSDRISIYMKDIKRKLEIDLSKTLQTNLCVLDFKLERPFYRRDSVEEVQFLSKREMGSRCLRETISFIF